MVEQGARLTFDEKVLLVIFTLGIFRAVAAFIVYAMGGGFVVEVFP